MACERGNLVVWRVAGNREAVGNGESGLTKTRAIEGLAAYSGQIVGANVVEAQEKHERAEKPTTPRSSGTPMAATAAINRV